MASAGTPTQDMSTHPQATSMRMLGYGLIILITSMSFGPNSLSSHINYIAIPIILCGYECVIRNANDKAKVIFKWLAPIYVLVMAHFGVNEGLNICLNFMRILISSVSCSMMFHLAERSSQCALCNFQSMNDLKTCCVNLDSQLQSLETKVCTKNLEPVEGKVSESLESLTQQVNTLTQQVTNMNDTLLKNHNLVCTLSEKLSEKLSEYHTLVVQTIDSIGQDCNKVLQDLIVVHKQ